MEAASSRIQSQGGVGGAERRRDGQPTGQSVRRAPHDGPSVEKGSAWRRFRRI